MILTCPECATSYFVEDAAIGDGRTVRCASCGASWRATLKPPLELVSTPEEGAFGAEPASWPGEPAEPAPATLPAEVLPKVFRARAENERKVREAAVQGAIWAGMGAAVALLLVVGVVFRIEVVRVWPKAASVYAAVNLPVNRIGLTIEKVHAQPSLQDGRPALVVSGVLRNIRAKPVTAPPLSIVLLDRQGKPLARRTASPGDRTVPAGQTRSFAVSLVDPPTAAADLEVTFMAEAAPPTRKTPAGPGRSADHPAAARPVHGDARAMLLGPAVEEATALPSSSPYALDDPPPR